MHKHQPHLLLIRHGQTTANDEEIAHGQTESPLNPRGEQQAAAAGQYLAKLGLRYQAIYSSPLGRALQTSQAIAAPLGLTVQTQEDLKEGHLGDWEGVSYQQLGANKFAEHSISDNDFAGHGGESPRVLATRMAEALSNIADNHPNDNIIVVSHGAAIAHGIAKLLQRKSLFGPRFIMHNTGMAKLFFQPEIKLGQLNFCEHLSAHLLD